MDYTLEVGDYLEGLQIAPNKAYSKDLLDEGAIVPTNLSHEKLFVELDLNVHVANELPEIL